MSSKDKYVAYVSTYTMNDNHGITIYDVDVKNGRFEKKSQVEITNSSYLTISHNQKYLYSITDFGVESFKILKDGSTREEQVVLSEYIRHQIHHPENTYNAHFTEQQLQSSIQMLREFVQTIA